MTPPTFHTIADAIRFTIESGGVEAARSAVRPPIDATDEELTDAALALIYARLCRCETTVARVATLQSALDSHRAWRERTLPNDPYRPTLDLIIKTLERWAGGLIDGQAQAHVEGRAA